MKTSVAMSCFAFALLACGNVLAGSEGASNTFYGTNAGTNTAGDDDAATFVGVDAGANTTGADNTFIGHSAGTSNSTGFRNTFVGSGAGSGNTTADSNTFVGVDAGLSTTTGSRNTFVGSNSGDSNTIGYFNTFVGNYAGASNISGYNNTFLGNAAGTDNTGYQNTFVGHAAGTNNTTANDNTFVGSGAGAANTIGASNTFVGGTAGSFNTTGAQNTFVGYQSGYTNTTGSRNIFSGYHAGFANTTGFRNSFNGHEAGYSNTTGNRNNFLGYRAGYNNTTGDRNSFFGVAAGYNNTTGSSNVFLGARAGYNETGSNQLYIDSSPTSNPLIHGDFALNAVTVNGDLNVTGNLTKGAGAFVQPHPSDPAKEIVYAFFEGPEHAVFLRGKANLVDGRAVIETPEHFRAVAGDAEDITVQLTPRSTETFGLAAVDVTKEKIDVRELKGETHSFEFDYFITAKRAGFENHQPIQPNIHFTADGKRAIDFEQAYARTDDLTTSALRTLLISNGVLTPDGKLNRQTAATLGRVVLDDQAALRAPAN